LWIKKVLDVAYSVESLQEEAESNELTIQTKLKAIAS